MQKFVWSILPGNLARLVMLFTILTVSGISHASPALDKNTWISTDSQGGTRIHLYFFWSRKCPHCLHAKPFVELLAEEHEWLILHKKEVTEHPKNAALYRQMAAHLLRKARSVPGFLFCETMLVGYDSEGAMAATLEENLIACHKHIQAGGTLAEFREEYQLEEEQTRKVQIPIIGTLDLDDLSLPLMTVVIAALDAFNPCAFFVLLFLLTMMVHAQSRFRIALIGGIFVLISGLMYFLFMAAWLNIFLIVGQLKWITLAAGSIAIAISLINIKDYFWFKRGISLTLSDEVKPGLFQRMRGLLGNQSMSAMIMGTAILAILANLYEFICTAGFPMVFTRILTLEKIPTLHYYLYLVLYNIVYVIPLAIIVILFSITLGKRKLQEHEGRILKLLSGLMMLSLGAIIVAAPELLNNVLTALGILLLAVTGTVVIVMIEKMNRQSG